MLSSPPHPGRVPDLQLCSGGTDTWSDSVSSVPESPQSEVSTLQINIPSTGTCSLDKKKDQDTERQVRPMLSKAQNPILNFGENPWLRKWALQWQGWGLQGQGTSGRITYPNMKEGGKEDGRKRG